MAIMLALISVTKGTFVEINLNYKLNLIFMIPFSFFRIVSRLHVDSDKVEAAQRILNQLRQTKLKDLVDQMKVLIEVLLICVLCICVRVGISY
jgi:hypothetical protein